MLSEEDGDIGSIPIGEDLDQVLRQSVDSFKEIRSEIEKRQTMFKDANT